MIFYEDGHPLGWIPFNFCSLIIVYMNWLLEGSVPWSHHRYSLFNFVWFSYAILRLMICLIAGVQDLSHIIGTCISQGFWWLTLLHLIIIFIWISGLCGIYHREYPRRYNESWGFLELGLGSFKNSIMGVDNNRWDVVLRDNWMG